MIDETLYEGREQTLVKHFVLRSYLERFALIIGSWATTLTYIDCFSGPWRARSPHLADTSFAIAIDTLRRARATLADQGKDLRLRCLFIETSASAYAQLKAFADTVGDLEVHTLHAEFEASIPQIIEFVRRGGADAFTFSFIDPTGWSGLAMDVISPLLRVRPGEVLINFMTDYIRRFVDAPEQSTNSEFIKMFGADVRAKVRGLPPEEREHALVTEYMASLTRHGAFSSVSSAIVFKPELESTYFHLIYGTRHDRGLAVFKEVERKMQPLMASVRTSAQVRKEQARTGQTSLLPRLGPLPSARHASLRSSYLEKAKRATLDFLDRHGTASYDDVWRVTLAFPLVWESDLKSWLDEWCEEIEVLGLGDREKKPKVGRGHSLRRKRAER
jgi:three-Cys-motif partner protein